MRRSALPLSFAILFLAATTAPAAPPKTCVFTISMISGIDVNNLDLTVNYAAAGGVVTGTETHPECGNALGGQAFAGFHDDDAANLLSVDSIRLSLYSAPRDIAGCRFLYDTVPPVPADFFVTVTNAGSGGLDNNVFPVPVVKVTAVDCPGSLPQPTTTTTLPPDTTTSTTLPSTGRCGFPSSDGIKPTASDALVALKAAVGLAECALCVCDVNSNGSVGASDALAILRAAVGLDTPLDCPAC